jgi:hypothetical protein
MFCVRKGTHVSICKTNDYRRQWREHVMQKDVYANLPKRRDVRGSSGALVLERDGWYILLRRSKARKVDRQETLWAEEA